MQPTKDSFYVVLRNRLVAVDPNRQVTLDGATRPAIAVIENEPPSGAPLLCDTFYLHWGNARPAALSAGSLMAMECSISYCTKGSIQNASLDRGRDLANLDNDLLAMCWPPQTDKCDYSSGQPVALGSTIFWTLPVLNTAKSTPPYVGRDVTVTVFFYPEVSQS
ncbi:MAG TPA: hypothetical protein VLV47_00390 [Candidatus Bathyarchaeia archaeon]|nr:hypothetical protein [Candidatus Bathyarchaeia archaeon]